MEKIIAEKASWHKNCFRCIECSKQLTPETYQSHEGSLYCPAHFKDLFRPKVAVQDEKEKLLERMKRRPQMIILESEPSELPPDVVRGSDKPNYGLEELQCLKVKEKFALFENNSKEQVTPELQSPSVQRSQSMVSRASKFFDGLELSIDNIKDQEDYDEGADQDISDDEMENGNESCKKKQPVHFRAMLDLKDSWEQKQKRECMVRARKEEIGKFRQILCAGKNHSLKEKFEADLIEPRNTTEKCKQQIDIETSVAARCLMECFEKGRAFISEGEEVQPKSDDIEEEDEIKLTFKEAATAKEARDVFKNIDSHLCKQENSVLRSKSLTQTASSKRLSHDMSFLRLQTTPSSSDVVKSSETIEDAKIDTLDLIDRFKFFCDYEKREEQKKNTHKKAFRITPPREGAEQGMVSSEIVEMGRNANLVRSSDNYEDEVDCTNTKNILQMFKNMEQGQERDEQKGPRPLKRFTPPLDVTEQTSESFSDDEEYTESVYSSEDEDEKYKYKDEILEMLSARKAASLRAKFEKYENDVNQQSSYDTGMKEEETFDVKQSLDTTRNLKNIFETKAKELEQTKRSSSSIKINRFV